MSCCSRLERPSNPAPQWTVCASGSNNKQAIGRGNHEALTRELNRIGILASNLLKRLANLAFRRCWLSLTEVVEHVMEVILRIVLIVRLDDFPQFALG